ncbi:HAMP domain-containing histidine kinase [Candidatus Gracilibacteria bacterium]|nr:HAMP domain-containing histidine kinase [Candidatus Gracilibacteria bacterium]
MNSLELLEKHRQKMGLILGLIIHILLYIAIIGTQSIIVYYELRDISDTIWRDTVRALSFTFLILIIATPFLYSILAYLSCRVMHRIYKPIKESISNLEDFAENINHEFKTGISEIISSSELARETKLYEETNEKVLGSAKRLSDILTSLSVLIYFVNLDYKKKKINIIEFLDMSIEDFEIRLQEKNIEIIKKYNPKEKIYVYIDSAPLLLCFQNILKNAIRYSEVGGNIEIIITRMYFCIKDYGIGIAAENKEKIFERHFRESYSGGGNGLGLSLVKKICTIYNWKVEVESEKGEYSEFRVYFG